MATQGADPPGMPGAHFSGGGTAEAAAGKMQPERSDRLALSERSGGLRPARLCVIRSVLFPWCRDFHIRLPG